MSIGRKVTTILLLALAGAPALASSQAGEAEVAPAQPPFEQASDERGPSVTIAKRVVDSAGAFERYVRLATTIRPDFDGAAAVNAAVMTSAGYHPRQLEEGAVAYAALVALQEPRFAQGLSRLADDPSGRAAVMERLTRTPELVLEVEGAREAGGRASAALARMGSMLIERGEAVKHAAYTIQIQPWSLQPVDDPARRLSQVKARSASPARLSESETQQLLAAIVAHRRDSQAAAVSAPTPTIVRGLALAAAAMLGGADEDRVDELAPLLASSDTGGCLKMAKLNLHQCLAVAGPHYEDVYCAGLYAMADTGQCIVKAAHGRTTRGVAVPVAGRRVSAAVSVPVALGSGAPDAYGPDTASDAAATEPAQEVQEADRSDTELSWPAQAAPSASGEDY